MSRFLVVSLLLAACSGDMSALAPPDLAEAPTDLAPPASDSAAPADLAGGDLTPPADLAEPPADLTPTCGELGQACCAAYACAARTDGVSVVCMRSETDGRQACAQVSGSCGGYNMPACSFQGEAWCGQRSGFPAGSFMTQNPCHDVAS